MTIELATNTLDLGIVTNKGEVMLAFYRDLLGLPVVADMQLPDGNRLYKLQCGDAVIKLLVLATPAPNENCRGGYHAATGFRYCCLTIRNLHEVVARCREVGHKIAVDVMTLRPGTLVAMIEDPDGNSLELMQLTAQAEELPA
jgi:catechol 2,3-dioxygenase-like lactoylglutathione lyase family enzyme